MGPTKKELRLYTDVAPGKTERLDYVVPKDSEFNLEEMFLSGAYSPSTKASIVWDSVTLFSSYGDSKQSFKKILPGDGVKALSVILENSDLIATFAMGGLIVGKEIEAEFIKKSFSESEAVAEVV